MLGHGAVAGKGTEDEGGPQSGRRVAVLALETCAPPAELKERTTGARLSLKRVCVHGWGWRTRVRLVRVVKTCQCLGRFMLCPRL